MVKVTYILCFVSCYLIGIGTAYAQEISRDSLLTVSREIIRNAGNCALITSDESGQPRVRTMDPFPPEKNMEVWLGTNSLSRKVDQIKNDPRVSLYYFDKENAAYVIIYGKAILIDDPQIKETKWKKEWEAFYPDNERNYLLIQVVPETMEVLSPMHGVNNDPVTWKPPIVEF